ncbi:MAG: hypothetical protein A2Y75_10085 [Candidatus Solincola sediminis]|uniref:LppX_LprAFG lipoprotein n=1 Tax=Candidatus Solincola sediminis TaxID=1797199 RepID=A0A1F2WI01_9ACTN|nr:MAG: hypothetical protein A2Y75_10085 [Candidatus Solincola sediminis]
MRWLRLFFAPTLAVMLLSVTLIGCGSPPPSREAQQRLDIDASLHELRAAPSYRYRINLENWIGVSAQSISGVQNGEGSFANDGFALELLQKSPAGETNNSVLSFEGKVYVGEGGEWQEVGIEGLPSPLCDPRNFLEIASSYSSMQLEAEEEKGGINTRRYLLKPNTDKARLAISSLGWSYFSQLRFEIDCRIWIPQPPASPPALQIEITGFDPVESLQRYRLSATLEPYDIGSSEIEVTLPQSLTP